MARFPETQWSLIRRSGETPSLRHAAFADLARDYRPAITAYFRARLRAADADDATQSFLSASFEHAWWARARAECGSFRGFLLLLLRRHLGHLLDQQRITEPLHALAETTDAAADAERQFDARFVMHLTATALAALRLHYRDRGREELYTRLVELLISPPEHGELRAVASTMGLPPNTLTVELRRLRARLRQEMRHQLLQLCANQDTFNQEWLALQSVIRGPQ